MNVETQTVVRVDLTEVERDEVLAYLHFALSKDNVQAPEAIWQLQHLLQHDPNRVVSPLREAKAK